VSNVDVFPTICEYAGIDVPDWVEGVSLGPLARGETDSVRDEIFSEVTYHAAYEPKRCVRTDRYKYIRRYDEDYTQWVVGNVNGGLSPSYLKEQGLDDTGVLNCNEARSGSSKSFVLERGLADRERPREALYDCHLDPNERDNLIDDLAYRDVKSDLRDQLNGWMSRTDDPLLRGPVPKPPGARAILRDSISGAENRYEPDDAR
jgi:hypothetical protein